MLKTLLERRRWVIALCAALALAMLPGLGQIEQNNAPEVFFVRDAAALERFRELELHFGRARGVRIVLSGAGLWTESGLAWLGTLEPRARAVHGVLGVAGLRGHHDWRLTAWPPGDGEAFRREVAADPLDRNAGWVGIDGEVVTVLVGFYKLSAAEQRRALETLDALLGTAPPGVDTALAGISELNRTLDQALIDMARLFFPPLALIAVLLVAVVLGRARHVALPFIVVAFCLVVVFGAIGYAGVRLNLITIILAPLLFVITLATAVHVLLAFRAAAEATSDPIAAVLETYSVKGWPVFWAGVTTALGFGSLTLSRVPPVQELGAWSAAAIAFMTVTMLTMYPALLAGRAAPSADARPPRFDAWARRQGAAWAQWAVRRRRAVFWVFALTGLVLLAGVSRLEVKTNLRDYFGPEHPLRVTLAKLEQAGIGAFGADLVLIREQPAGPSFGEPAELERLAELAAALRTIEPVRGVVSAADLVDGVRRYAGEATDPTRAALAQIRADPDQGLMLDLFLARRGDRTRVALFLPLAGYTDLEPALEQVRATASRLFPDATVWVSGQYPLVLAAQRNLLATMLKSLSVTLAGIGAVLWVVLRGLRLALAAMLANVWPVAFVLGLMGWSGIPVDSTTVMIAAVALGLAVDDTLHSLGFFRAQLGRLEPAPAAIAAIQRSAAAHLVTSLVLALGFGMLVLSAFVPVARFGGLTALALLAALVADLLLVPALLASLPRAALARFSRAGAR